MSSFHSITGFLVASLYVPIGFAQVRAPIGKISTDWFAVGQVASAPRVDDGPEATVEARLLSPPGAQMCRAQFREWNLPPGTRLRLTSTTTGEAADMDAAALTEWSGFTPIFNGGTLLIELVCTPPHEAASVVIERVASIVDADGAGAGIQNRALCGPDDRVRDSSGPVARLWNVGVVCTASLIMTGEHMVSAGHCGPLLSNALVEFDPPDSTTGGNRVAAPPDRQFPFIVGSELRDSDFTLEPCPEPNQAQMCITSLGDDAMVFRVARNVNGQTAGQSRGTHMPIYRYSLLGFVPQQNGFRKWGCGVMVPANNVFSMTMKRVDGVLLTSSNLDGGWYWGYQQDQTGGDSGGPIISTTLGAAIGVMSFSDSNGCTAGSFSFSDSDFSGLIESAVQADTTKFVDHANSTRPSNTSVDGSIWNPSLLFSDAYRFVPPTGRILISPGTYAVGGGDLTRPCTIVAPLGSVTLTR